MWTVPIYSGGKNIGNFLPPSSVIPFDRVNTEVEEVLRIVKTDYREKHLEDIREARNLLLNKYQVSKSIYLDIISGSYKLIFNFFHSLFFRYG